MKIFILLFLFLSSLLTQAQLPKWILGNSQYNSNGNFYPLASGQLAFHEIDFSNGINYTERIVGESIENISSVGTQDVMLTANGESGEVLFYVFAAPTVPFQSGGPSVPDKIYFAAFDSTTGADEIFGFVTTDGWASSVIESELVRVPGSEDLFYFIYKTDATSQSNDDIKYVTINAIDHTITSPTILANSLRNGEGMAVSQIICPQIREDEPYRWLFTSRLDNDDNIIISKFKVTAGGINFDSEHFISIPGNNSGVVCAIEISPDNTLLAIANYNTAGVDQDVILFDLNGLSGELSNERFYMNELENPFVTMEFSPDVSRIFLMQGGSSNYPTKVYSCPVVSQNYTVTSADLLSGITLSNTLTMEIAFDQKLYILPNPDANFLYVVNEPNADNPIVTSTNTNLFGTGNRIGSGFPDQVDGENPLVKGCDLPDNVLEFFVSSVDLVIYPNPTRDLLQIEFRNLNQVPQLIDLEITNSLGQLVKKVQNASTSSIVKLEVTEFASGVYQIEGIHKGQIVARGKFIVE